MELKLFGKKIFEFSGKKRGHALFYNAHEELKNSKYLPDFYTADRQMEESNYAIIEAPSGGTVAVPIKDKLPKRKPKKLTPKGVYELKMLHDKTFELNTNPKYVDQQLADFQDKLGLISAEEYDMRRGVQEVSSMVCRLENRKKYASVRPYFEEYAYTTTTKIKEVLGKHDYLKLGQVAQFIADMPQEAVEAMKKYNEGTKKLCDKQAVFYIVADKKDFKQTDKRRDPILLAQSPFGHFWQILGAWDKEMLFLEEL